MQGNGDQNLEFLDAGGLVGHLGPQGSVCAFLAEHRRGLFPDDMFSDLFLSQRGRPSAPVSVIRRVRRQVPVAAAVAILNALDGVDLGDDEAALVGLLALVAGQDVEPADEEEGIWRIFDGTVPDRVISTVDPETRHMHTSRSSYRDGYKAHIAVERETGSSPPVI